MSNTKHTPGPWHTDGKDVWVENGLNVDQASITRRVDTEANARLIAAAPELLDALQMLANKVFGHGYGEPTEDDRQRIIALLNKATGTNA